MRRLALALALFAPLSFAGQGDSALKSLFKALGSQRDVRATLIQTRSDGEQTITVNVQIVPRRGIVAKVTKPLLFAGMVSFDDGQQWKNYDPQLDLLRIEPSPAKFQLDMDFRRRLIEKNYTVTSEREALVAGRKALVVLAKPRSNDVATRRLYIDAETALILRYIVEEPDGKVVTTVDTKSVDFESAIDLTQFDRIGGSASKVEKSWGPIEVSTASGAARYTGFTPFVPSSLASGFSLQAIHVVGTQQRPFVGMRLTDGMAVVTVYAWRAVSGEPMEKEPFKGACDARGGSSTRIKVVGEASTRLRGELARTFAKGYEGPPVGSGTSSDPRHVQDRKNPGGGTRPQPPQIVIDHEQ